MSILGQPARHEDFDRVVDKTCDLMGDDGAYVFRFIKNALPHRATVAGRAWIDIDTREPPSLTRRRAAGLLDLARFREWRPEIVGLEPVSPTSARPVLADGRTLRQVMSNPVRSYVAGYTLSRFGRIASPAALTRRHPHRWSRSLPLFAAVDAVLRDALPLAHRRMLNRANHHPAWRIGATALSTVAINVNYASHYHRDSGDYKDGYSTLTVIEDDDYTGGLFVMPGHRVAIDVREGDVLLCRSHVEAHGNTPVVGAGRRVSFVTYLKHGLADAVNAQAAA